MIEVRTKEDVLSTVRPRAPFSTSFDDARLPASSGVLPPSTGEIPVTLGRVSGDYRLHMDGDLHLVKDRRPRFGDLVFMRRFTTFDRLNPAASTSPFHGFYVLAWLAVFLWVVKVTAENYRRTGRLMEGEILALMFDRARATECLLVDVAMFYGSALWCVPLQKVVAKGRINWGREGWAMQALVQSAILAVVLRLSFVRDWSWIQNVFLVLHSLVVIMKMHSYAAFNGYLSSISKRQQDLQRRLSTIPPGEDDEYRALISRELEICGKELSAEAENSPSVSYPANLTWRNYLLYLHFPTVVYELAYPRSPRIDYHAVAEKLAATFGILFVMVLISQVYIYPVVAYCHTQPSAQEYPWILLQLMFPLTAEYMLTWYVIWEVILNLLAEVTRFADRGFYQDWWNATSWDAFARDWNVPVHAFLLRHVYHSAISTLKVSRQTATVTTFLISSLVHEIVMWVIFKKLRGYLLVAQMGQLPLVWASRSRFLKGKRTMGNIAFWVGIAMGPGFLSAGYLLI